MSLRRRSLLHAAWVTPAVTVVSAAPANASSTDPWIITSDSWEGGPGGLRFTALDRYFELAIEIPAGTTVANPQVQFSFAAGGDGADLGGLLLGTSGSVPDGNGGAWTFTSSDGDLVQRRLWIFTHETVTGPATIRLDVHFALTSDFDIDESSRVVFSSGSAATGPTVTYRQLDDNDPTAISPSGQILERLP